MTPVAVASAGGSSTDDHGLSPTIPPIQADETTTEAEAEALISSFCTSLKSYVTAQIGSRLDSIMATQTTAPHVASPPNKSTSKSKTATSSSPLPPQPQPSREVLLARATLDFPFLASVDWNAERLARMDQCRRVIDARTAQGPLAVRKQHLEHVKAAGQAAEETLAQNGEVLTNGKKPIKRKRGRPRKVKGEEILVMPPDVDRIDVGSGGGGEKVKRKRGRPKKKVKKGDFTPGTSSAIDAFLAGRAEAEASAAAAAAEQEAGKRKRKGKDPPPAAAAMTSAQRVAAAARLASATPPYKRRCKWDPSNPNPTKSDSEESYKPDDSEEEDTLKQPLPGTTKRKNECPRVSWNSLLSAKKDEEKQQQTEKSKRGPRVSWNNLEKRLQQCLEYKRQHGHLNIPPYKKVVQKDGVDENQEDDDDNDEHQEGAGGDMEEQYPGLAQWAHRIRYDYKKFFDGHFDVPKKGGRGSKATVGNKLEILEDLGFVFEVDKEGNNDDDETARATAAAEAGAAAAKLSKRVWEWHLEECRRFKEENGHMNVPHHHKKIGAFADRMRDLYNRRLEGGKLTESEREKVRVLESMGFAFDRSFDVNLQKLVAYKENKGHCRVPIKYDPDRALGHWAELCRRENRRERSDYLTLDRMRKLTAVGFEFGPRVTTKTWEENFEKLKAYREEHGKDPPTSHREIGNWVTKMRVYYNHKLDGRKHHLSEDRERKLHEIGFVFQVGSRPNAEAMAAQERGFKVSWEDRLAEFIRWKERHGHPYVPTVCDNEDKQLGRWVAKQRQAYRAYKEGIPNRKYGMLTAEKALTLANAGFAFDASDIRRTPKDIGNVDVPVDDEVVDDDAGGDENNHYHDGMPDHGTQEEEAMVQNEWI